MSNAKQIAQSYMEAWSAHDSSKIAALCSTSATYSDYSHEGPASNMLRDLISRTSSAIPNAKWEVNRITTSDNGCITLEWTISDSSNTSSDSLKIPGVDIIEMQGDKIARIKSYFDSKILSSRVQW